MSYRISEQTIISFEMVRCCSCGVAFMLESNYKSRRLEDGEEFYCPNGHPQRYTESTQAKLNIATAEISRLKSQVQLERDQKAATETSLLRIKKRVSAGTCPCCHRTVGQLARHMKSKHPKYPATL